MNGTLTPVAPAQNDDPVIALVLMVPIEVTFPLKVKSSTLIEPVNPPPKVITTDTVPVSPEIGVPKVTVPVLAPPVGIVPEPASVPLMVILYVFPVWLDSLQKLNELMVVEKPGATSKFNVQGLLVFILVHAMAWPAEPVKLFQLPTLFDQDELLKLAFKIPGVGVAVGDTVYG